MLSEDRKLEELIGGNYTLLNNDIVRIFGCAKAVFLTFMLKKYKEVRYSNTLYEGRWFFYRREDISKDLKMSFETQMKYINEFKKLHCLETKMVKDRNGRKLYYAVNPLEIYEYIINNKVK